MRYKDYKAINKYISDNSLDALSDQAVADDLNTVDVQSAKSDKQDELDLYDALSATDADAIMQAIEEVQGSNRQLARRFEAFKSKGIEISNPKAQAFIDLLPALTTSAATPITTAQATAFKNIGFETITRAANIGIKRTVLAQHVNYARAL